MSQASIGLVQLIIIVIIIVIHYMCCFAGIWPAVGDRVVGDREKKGNCDIVTNLNFQNYLAVIGTRLSCHAFGMARGVIIIEILKINYYYYTMLKFIHE